MTAERTSEKTQLQVTWGDRARCPSGQLDIPTTQIEVYGPDVILQWGVGNA